MQCKLTFKSEALGFISWMLQQIPFASSSSYSQLGLCTDPTHKRRGSGDTCLNPLLASEFESNQWNRKAAFIGILWSERIHVSILRIGVMQVPSWTYGLVRVVSWRCFPTARSPSCTCTVLIVVIRPYALKVGFTELPQNIQTSLNSLVQPFVLFPLQIHLVQQIHIFQFAFLHLQLQGFSTSTSPRIRARVIKPSARSGSETASGHIWGGRFIDATNSSMFIPTNCPPTEGINTSYDTKDTIMSKTVLGCYKSERHPCFLVFLGCWHTAKRLGLF